MYSKSFVLILVLVSLFDIFYANPPESGVATVNKSQAVGPCINEQCPMGHICVDAECYPEEIMNATETNRPKGAQVMDTSKAVGPCVNGECPSGYICREQNCYADSNQNTRNIRNPKGESVGPCVNGECPDGYVCYGNKCYSAIA